MEMSSRTFEDPVGKSVDVEEPGFSIEVTSVDKNDNHDSVLFKGPPTPVLDQATYTLRSGDDELGIFIVPISADDDGTVYGALGLELHPQEGVDLVLGPAGGRHLGPPGVRTERREEVMVRRARRS